MSVQTDYYIPELKRREDQISRQATEIARLRAALVVCGSAWVSGPGSVMACEKELHEEFNRRMQIAFDALRPDQQSTAGSR